MSRVYYVTLLAALVLALLAPLSLAGNLPPPPLPARLFMDPPTQAELDAQAALRPAGVAPLIRGSVFYDQDGDGSPESPQCDRGQRDLTVTLYQDAGVIGVYEPGLDTLVGTTVTDIIGNYLLRRCPRPPTTWCCWTWRIPICRPARWRPPPTRSLSVGGRPEQDGGPRRARARDCRRP